MWWVESLTLERVQFDDVDISGRGSRREKVQVNIFILKVSVFVSLGEYLGEDRGFHRGRPFQIATSIWEKAHTWKTTKQALKEKAKATSPLGTCFDCPRPSS